MVTDRRDRRRERDRSGHEKVFPIPGVNTRGYCSHLKPLSVRMRANEGEASSENQGKERTREKVGRRGGDQTKDRELAQEGKSVSVTSNKIACSLPKP